MKVSDFCNQCSISDRDRWALNKMYKDQEKTEDEWVKELKNKIVFKMPEKNSTFDQESKDEKPARQNKPKNNTK